MEKLRPYEKYEKHIDHLVAFGAVSSYLGGKYLKGFYNDEVDEAHKINNKLDQLLKEIEDSKYTITANDLAINLLTSGLEFYYMGGKTYKVINGGEVND